jgi:hypothetical protein
MNRRISSQLRRLEALLRRRSEIEAAVAQTVVMARVRGASWSAVGGALGVSAQAAQQRYGSLASSPAQSKARPKTKTGSAATLAKRTHYQPHPTTRPVRQDELIRLRPQRRTRTRKENRP